MCLWYEFIELVLVLLWCWKFEFEFILKGVEVGDDVIWGVVGGYGSIGLWWVVKGEEEVVVRKVGLDGNEVLGLWGGFGFGLRVFLRGGGCLVWLLLMFMIFLRLVMLRV